MAKDAYDYIYVVEWDESVHSPPYAAAHGVKLERGVEPTDFEQFVTEQGFASVGSVSTRVGKIEAQYLLAETTGEPPERAEDLDLELEQFGHRTSVRKFRVVARWRKADELSPGL